MMGAGVEAPFYRVLEARLPPPSVPAVPQARGECEDAPMPPVASHAPTGFVWGIGHSPSGAFPPVFGGVPAVSATPTMYEYGYGPWASKAAKRSRDGVPDACGGVGGPAVGGHDPCPLQKRSTYVS